MRNAILFALIAIVLVSGCIGQGIGGSLFTQPTTTEEVTDIIVTRDRTIIPSTVYAGSDFSIIFRVLNQHDTKSVSNVYVGLFDTGVCEATEISGHDVLTDRDNMIPGIYIETADSPVHSIDLSPGAEEPVEWKFDSPTNERIGGLRATCPISYRISYDTEAVTQVSAQIISPDRLRTLERSTGQRPSFQPEQSVGPGPIKMFFTFDNALPVESGSTLTLNMKVLNRGKGEFGDIMPTGEDALDLYLEVPEDWEVVGEPCEGKFTESGTAEEGMRSFKNYQRISVIKGESQTIKCRFTVPAVEEQRTDFVTAHMKYEYKVIEEINVPINPTG